MKKIIVIAGIIVAGLIQAQVAIGKTSISPISSTDTTPNPSILLEFDNSKIKGIVLPWVAGSNLTTSGEILEDDTKSPNGTFVLDRTAKKVKVKVNGDWKDLNEGAEVSNAIDASLQTNASYPEKDNARVIIGASASDAQGILVLESKTKAMVLPSIAKIHEKIKDPAPGMMVFDNTSGKELLCVYNGTQWSYWGWK